MDVKSFGTGPCRIVLVPGGPGLVVSSYQELIDLLAEDNEVVTYEPRGTYYRDPSDFPKSEIECADELEAIVTSLPRPEKPTLLLGHSFGGTVVIETMLRDLPIGGAVISNAYSSGKMLGRGVTYRLSLLSEDARARLATISKDDAEAMNKFLAEIWYPSHFCRVNPWPESLVDALGKLNPAFMAHFIGTNIVEMNGAAATWDRENNLHEIRQPVLVISGKNDYYREEDVAQMASLFAEGTAWISETASHTPWLEDPDNFMSHLEPFLERFR